MPFELELATAVHAARAGGEVLQRHAMAGVAMRRKRADSVSYDLVSDADIESEREIVRIIRQAFPADEIIGEEGTDGDADAQRLWIIDPLDGTNNYAHGVPHYAVSIGFYHGGDGAAGVVHRPGDGSCYTATRGGGSHVGVGDAAVPVRCGDQRSLSEVLVGCGFYYDRGEIMRRTLNSIETLFGRDIHGIRRMGTASLDLVMVGLGMYGGFFEYELSPWDFAAGALFVREAGGIVSTTQGGPLPVAKSSVLAAAPGIHPALLQIVRQGG